MKHIHFIAIGGSAMHSLALELQALGYTVTGSDDAIFEPSRSKLEAAGLLPPALGWFPERLKTSVDRVILGMHARVDNPELVAAQKMGLTIQSYPEFLAECLQDKTRVVIAGSHGKTTITSMILHVLNYHEQTVDYMVGAPVKGLSKTLSLTADNSFALLEGDEYLSSAIDRRSKFLWYQPQIAIITGIAWDHVNVFTTFEDYVKTFEAFVLSLSEGGVLLYNETDEVLKNLVENTTHPIKKIPYQLPEYSIEKGQTYWTTPEGKLPLPFFGEHNLLNANGARWVLQLMGVDQTDFYEAISSFKGAAKRLELLAKGPTAYLYKDFAHAPSKVKASVEAVQKQFQQHRIIACFELHTYSSTDPTFLNQYQSAFSNIDIAAVFFDPEALKIKNRPLLETAEIKKAFGREDLVVLDTPLELEAFLDQQDFSNTLLLMMSSGNFGGLEWRLLEEKISRS